jgi:hypothetical protein
MIVNSEQVRIWKEAVVTTSRYYPKIRQHTVNTTMINLIQVRSKIEAATFRIRSWSANDSTTRLGEQGRRNTVNE